MRVKKKKYFWEPNSFDLKTKHAELETYGLKGQI